MPFRTKILVRRNENVPFHAKILIRRSRNVPFRAEVLVRRSKNVPFHTKILIRRSENAHFHSVVLIFWRYKALYSLVILLLRPAESFPRPSASLQASADGRRGAPEGVVSSETVSFSASAGRSEDKFCTISLPVCNFIVPLPPKSIKIRIDEKKLVNRHSAADGFNPNFRGRFPDKYQSECPILAHAGA